MEHIVDAGMELGKRKRSPSSSSLAAIAAAGARPSKAIAGGSFSINYLARQSPHDLPLLNKDDSLPNLINLLTAYSSVLDRQESLASNLGARPLGPILIKRFERCFDAPPKVIASHQKLSNGVLEDASPTITWLEVIEFARSHPSQFTLSTFSEGRRVCQFYYPQKQLRAQISEEDFLFINSGRCQELIPPLPIWEDEEKEVGACDVLDGKLRELTNVADMVAARTRQLSHRLKGRRAAILERRAEGGSGTYAKAGMQQTATAPPLPSPGPPGYAPYPHVEAPPKPADEAHETNPGSLTAVRSELLRHFESLPHNQNAQHNQNANWAQTRQASNAGFPEPQPPPRQVEQHEHPPTAHNPMSTASSMSPAPQHSSVLENMAGRPVESIRRMPSITNPVPNFRAAAPAPATPSQAPLKHNFSRPLNPALESSQPFRPLCQAHMDSLPRGHRVLPPCDRCRRLRMDCQKNLTSCAGCTKKHARCHWRDVRPDEVGALDHLMETAYSGDYDNSELNNSYSHDNRADDSEEDDDENPLEDLEALGNKVDQAAQDLTTRRPSQNEWSGRDRGPPPESESIQIAKGIRKDSQPNVAQDDNKITINQQLSPKHKESSVAHRMSIDRHINDVHTPSVANLTHADSPIQAQSNHGGFRAVNDLLRAAGSTNGLKLS